MSVVIAVAAYLACIGCALYRPTAFVADDAYFYLEIARNIADGYGVTFNRLVATNGFHPLWELCLVPVAWLPIDRISYLRVMIVFSGGLGIAAFFLICKTLESLECGGFCFIGLAPLVCLLGPLATVGSEAFVNAAALGLAAFVYFGRQSETQRAALLEGGVLGLLMLARLDNVFLAGSLCLYAWYRWNVRRAVVAFLTASAAIIPYLVWNVWSFGSAEPVSSWVKSSFPVVGPHVGGLSQMHTALLAVTILGLVLAVLAPVKDEFRSIVLTLAVPALAHGAYHYLFQSSASWYWYAVLPAFTVGFCGALIARQLAGHVSGLSSRRVEYGGIVSSIAVAGLVLTFAVEERLDSRRHWTLRLADAVREQVGPDEVLLAADVPGRIQFWGEAKTLALDGLTTNIPFQKKLVSEGPSLLRELGVDTIVWRGGDPLMVPNCVRRDDRCRRRSLTLRPKKHGLGEIGEIYVESSDEIADWTFDRASEDERAVLWRWRRGDVD